MHNNTFFSTVFPHFGGFFLAVLPRFSSFVNILKPNRSCWIGDCPRKILRCASFTTVYLYLSCVKFGSKQQRSLKVQGKGSERVSLKAQILFRIWSTKTAFVFVFCSSHTRTTHCLTDSPRHRTSVLFFYLHYLPFKSGRCRGISSVAFFHICFLCGACGQLLHAVPHCLPGCGFW